MEGDRGRANSRLAATSPFHPVAAEGPPGVKAAINIESPAMTVLKMSASFFVDSPGRTQQLGHQHGPLVYDVKIIKNQQLDS